MRHRVRHSSRIACVLACAIAVSATSVAHAQSSSAPGSFEPFELRPFVGVFIPTGSQHQALGTAVDAGAQLSWVLRPSFAVVGTLGWSPSHDKMTADQNSSLYTGDTEKLDVMQYDLGIELRMPTALGPNMMWGLSPFVGIGGGARTYNYRSSYIRDLFGASRQTEGDGYVALGADMSPSIFGPIGLRIEARDYVSRFSGLRGEYTDPRWHNDVWLNAGLSFRF